MFKKFLAKVSRNELISYVIATIVVVIGLVFLILGIVADNLPVTSELAKAQPAFPWRYIGLIVIAVGITVYLVTLLIYAKQVDRVYDKEKRRKQRLQAMMSDAKDEDTFVVNEQGQVEAKETKTIEETPIENKPVEEIKSATVENATIPETSQDKVEPQPQVKPDNSNGNI